MRRSSPRCCLGALASSVAASGWSVVRAANGEALEASPPPPQLSSDFFGNSRCCFKVCNFYKTICGVIFSLRIDLSEENNSEMRAVLSLFTPPLQRSPELQS